jgi:putative inorganic carbon (HCO3(-)) transporter
MDPNRLRRWLRLSLLGVFLLALAVRVVVVLLYGEPNIVSYSESGMVAQSLVEGNGFAFNLYGTRQDNPLLSFMPPLFPLLIAFCLRYFQDPALALQLIQAFLSSLTSVCLYFVAYKISSNRAVGWLTALGTALYPVFVIMSAYPPSLTLNTFLLSLFLVAALVLRQRMTMVPAAATGLILGLLLLTRPMLLGLLPILIAWLWVDMSHARRKVVTVALAVLASTLITILPWTVRNLQIHRQFVFISTNGGITFWNGNNPFTTGSGHDVYSELLDRYLGVPHDLDKPEILQMAPYPLPKQVQEQLSTLDEVTLDRMLYEAGFQFIRDHPDRWLNLALAKLKGFWSFRTNIGAGYEQAWTGYYKLIYVVLLGVMMPGLVLSLRRWQRYLLVYLLFAYYTMVTVVFHVQTRFRWEIEPLFLLFAALTISYALQRRLKWLVLHDLDGVRGPRAAPRWLPYVDLACAAVAGGLWYAWPHLGGWPLVVALAPWAIRLALTGQLGQRTPFDVPLALFLATAGLGVWVAYDRQAAWSKFWLIVGGIVLFYALVNARPPGVRRRWLLAGLGAGMGLYFVATHDWGAQPVKAASLARLGRAMQGLLPSLPGPPLNPNVAAGFVVAMLPFTGLVAIQALQRFRCAPRSRRPRHAWILGAAWGLLAVTLVGLVVTRSRGSWLALGGALLIMGLWFVAGRLSRGAVGWRVWVFAGLLLLVCALGLGVALALPSESVVLDVLPGLASGFSRLDLMGASLTLVRDYPFLGAGLNSYQMLHATYVLLVHVGYITHSHNLFIDVVIEQGLVGLLALVWMWVLFFRAVVRQTTQANVLAESGTLAAAGLSLVIILLHGMIDNVLYSSGGVLLFFVPLAFGARASRRRSRQPRRWIELSLPAGITLLFVLALVWRSALLSRFYSNLGAVHQSQAELSLYAWPTWHSPDDVRRSVDLSQPISEFERALAFDPRNPTANRRLGTIELSLGEYEKALKHLEAAYAVEPESATTRQLYGEALIVNGRFDAGQALWTKVSNQQGQLALRASWYEHIGDMERAAWVKQAMRGG